MLVHIKCVKKKKEEIGTHFDTLNMRLYTYR